MTDFEINTSYMYVANHPSNLFNIIKIEKATKKMVEIRLFDNVSNDENIMRLREVDLLEQTKFKVKMMYNENDSSCSPVIEIAGYTYPINFDNKIQLTNIMFSFIN